jgi:hypothetical protein
MPCDSCWLSLEAFTDGGVEHIQATLKAMSGVLHLETSTTGFCQCPACDEAHHEDGEDGAHSQPAAWRRVKSP